MSNLSLDLPVPSYLANELQDAVPLPSPFALGSPLHDSVQLQHSSNMFFHPLTTPSALLGQHDTQEKESELASAMVVTEDESVRTRREAGERRFQEAQQQAAERRRVLEGNKENSPSRSRSTSRAPSTSPTKGLSLQRKRSPALDAQERLQHEARWAGRVEGGAGWWALLHENSEVYAEGHVSWVSAGEDELSVREMERLRREAERGNDVAVYLLWKRLTREAYYQRVGVSDARVARQLAAEFRVDPRIVDRAIELEDDLETKQRVADLLLSM